MSDFSYPPMQPADVTPPALSDMGSVGSNLRYAREDHTHASKVRRAVVAVGSSVGTYVWNFANPFAPGTTPVCQAIAQTARGVTDLINVQIDGAPTNSSMTVRITRYSQTFLSLLGINILGFNSGSIPITLHMTAAEA